MIAALLLLGCGGGEPGPALSYVEAAGSDPSACSAISDPELSAECVAMRARELYAAGEVEAARAACGGLVAGPWRDECHFLLADEEGVHGDRAREACAQTGRFRFQCLGPAISREASVLFREIPRGQEDRLLRELQALTGSYIDGPEALEKAGRLLAMELATRDPEAPFDLSLCGSAPATLCREAYRERVRRAAKSVNAEEDTGMWRQACARTVSVERAARFGLPTWTPEADPLVQEAWQELCRR